MTGVQTCALPISIAGPDDIRIENIPRLKQFIPLHESLMKNFKEQNFPFCVDAIGQLRGNINDFMDTFYDNVLERILEQQDTKDDYWSAEVDLWLNEMK